MGLPEGFASFLISPPSFACAEFRRPGLSLHLSHPSNVQSVSVLLVTWPPLLFQDLPDLEDVDAGEFLEGQDKVITQAFPQPA